MRKVLLLLMVVAIVIGTGFYLKWFSFAPTAGDEKTNVPITVDKEKIQTDVEKAKEKAKGVIEKITEKPKGGGAGDNEKTTGPAPTAPAKEKDQ